MNAINIAATLVLSDTSHSVFIIYGLVLRAPRVATLQVIHRDVGVDAIDGPAGLKAAVPTRFIVPCTLIWEVVVITEYRA